MSRQHPLAEQGAPVPLSRVAVVSLALVDLWVEPPPNPQLIEALGWP